MAIFPFFGSGGGQVDAGYLFRVLAGEMATRPPEEWTPEMWVYARQPGQLEQITGSTYDQVKGKDPQVIAQRQSEEQARIAAETQTATQTAPYTAPEPPPPPPPPPSPPPPQEPVETEEQRLAREMAEQENRRLEEARQREIQRQSLRTGAASQLESLLPAGFEQTLAPTSLYGPTVESIYSRERAKPEELISNMLKRGVLSETGRARGIQALETQTPAVRGRLTDIGNLLLEQERAGLRGIAGRGREAASTLDIGQTFDPGAYRREAEQNVASFQESLPGSFESHITGPLFPTGGLSETTGAVSAQPEAFDPYAVSGQLTTGLEGVSKTPKRRTSVF